MPGKRIKNKPRRAVAKTTRSYPNKINRSIGFPSCYHAKLRYAETISFAGVPPLTQQCRMNSLFDPNFTTTGHQPMYFDQMSIIYGNYVVSGARITVQINQTNANDYPAAYTLDIRNDSTTRSGTNIGQRLEDGGSSYVTLGYAGSGSASKSLSRYVDIAKQYGIKHKMSPADAEWTAPINNNPSKVVFATIQGMSVGSNTTSISSYMQIVIDYYCCFFNKKETAQS